MLPLQTAERTVSTAWFYLALVVPGLVAAVLWSPFLASARLRALFGSLPPLRSLFPNYLLATVGGSLPYVLGTGAAVVWTHEQAGSGPGTGAAMAEGILGVLVTVSLAYLVGVPLLAGWLLPEAGLDWDPAGYDAATWALLVLGAAWYAAMFAVPLFVVVFFLALPT